MRFVRLLDEKLNHHTLTQQAINPFGSENLILELRSEMHPYGHSATFQVHLILSQTLRIRVIDR